MYNPSRGGVRGGADQFSWETVKTDKHRENYLGHSLKAPVGRWQKGKDLSWYAKERKEGENVKQAERSELAAIKRAEEEAMLIALGHNVIRKETQTLTKEEMTEALKRNIGDRDELNIERIDGVGVKSGRAALLAGVSRDSRMKNEGIAFETRKDTKAEQEDSNEENLSGKKSKSKKKSKKHKKEKKKRRHEENDSEDELAEMKKHTRMKRNQDTSDSVDSEHDTSSKYKYKKGKRKHSASDSGDSVSIKRHKKDKKSHDKIDPDDPRDESDARKKHSKSSYGSKTKHKKKSKHKRQPFNDSDSEDHKTNRDKHRAQNNDVYSKRCRHDSESD